MSNKTISINTSYFNSGGSKTKKNKEKTNLKPLINPNVLKNKFLKRIKEHKQRETHILDEKTKNTETKVEQFSDEFSDSINYLQTLSKQKKINDEKTNYEKQKQRRKEVIEKKTIKNYQELNQPIINNQTNQNSSVHVNIDLPEELKLEMKPMQQTSSLMVLNKPDKDSIPYGILKGGLKPTYRDWTKTQRNNIVVNPNSALTIENSKINKEKMERELRLQNLREKLKNKKQEELFKTSIIEPIKTSIIEPNQYDLIPIPIKEQIIATKKITKKTIKRKYTLGKSKIKKSVGVLIKDRGTRKQIISAQRDLKKKSINEVKNYLRDHNLIKVGSNAPNDVIRKLYESAMLSGEITNSNSEILLHNLSKEEKQL